MKFLQVLPFFLIVFLAACGDSGTFGDGDTSDDAPMPAGTPDRTSILGPWETAMPANCNIIFDFGTQDVAQITVNGETILVDFAAGQIVNGLSELNLLSLTQEQLDMLGDDCAALENGQFFVEFSGNSMSWFPDADDDQANFTFDYIPFPEDVEDDSNTASLVEINPASAVIGSSTTFTVTLDYSVSVDSTLTVGLNEIFRDSFEVQDQLELMADAIGQEQFEVEGTTIDWGNDADFAVLVQITNTEGVVLSSYAFPIGITAAAP